MQYQAAIRNNAAIAANPAASRNDLRVCREEQFMSDFPTYERLESAGEDFAYVLITNEFDEMIN